MAVKIYNRILGTFHSRHGTIYSSNVNIIIYILDYTKAVFYTNIEYTYLLLCYVFFYYYYFSLIIYIFF